MDEVRESLLLDSYSWEGAETGLWALRALPQVWESNSHSAGEVEARTIALG